MKSNAHPPRLAQAICSGYCRNASAEDLEGDVEELYYKDAQQMVSYVSRYDEFHANKEQIYRLITERQHAGECEQFASRPLPSLKRSVAKCRE